jgi:hypothetical protein
MYQFFNLALCGQMKGDWSSILKPTGICLFIQFLFILVPTVQVQCAVISIYFTARNLRQRGSKQLSKKMRHADQANCTNRTCFLPVKFSSLRGARSTPEHSSP